MHRKLCKVTGKREITMFNLTTPKAIVIGFFFIALAIASIPYSAGIVSPALAFETSGIETELHWIRRAIMGIDCSH